MRRAALGIIGLILVLAGLTLHLAKLEAVSSTFSAAVMMKSGAVLLLFCLAYHQVVRLLEIVPPWMIAAALVSLGAIVAYPKSFIVVLCLFGGLVALHAAGLFLKPRVAKRRTKEKPESR